MVLKFSYPGFWASEPNCSPSIHFAWSRFASAFARIVLSECGERAENASCPELISAVARVSAWRKSTRDAHEEVSRIEQTALKKALRVNIPCLSQGEPDMSAQS